MRPHIYATVICSCIASGCSNEKTSHNTEDPVEVVAEYDAVYRANNPYDEMTVQRDAGAISTRRYVSSGPTSGPPIMLLHGYPDSQHLYDKLVPLLRTERDVVTFDFIGWGDSSKPSPATHVYNSASLLSDLEAVIAELDTKQLVMVVHDASGWPGVDWALANPERVAGLVILNTVYHPTATAIVPEGLALFAGMSGKRNALVERSLADDEFWIHGDAAAGALGYRWQIDVFMNDKDARDTLLPVFEAQSFAMRPAFMELAGILFEEVAARGARVPEMQAFEPPVRVVFGAADPYLNLGVAESFSAIFPNSTRVDIAGAHHYVQLDAPEAVATQVLAAGQVGD